MQIEAVNRSHIRTIKRPMARKVKLISPLRASPVGIIDKDLTGARALMAAVWVRAIKDATSTGVAGEEEGQAAKFKRSAITWLFHKEGEDAAIPLSMVAETFDREVEELRGIAREVIDSGVQVGRTTYHNYRDAIERFFLE